MALTGAVSLALAAVSSATSIAGGVAAQRAAKAEARFRNRLGMAEAEDQRRRNRRLFAAQKAAYAKAGIDPNSGSPLDVLSDSVQEAELQALRLRFSRQSQAESIRFQGKLARDTSIIRGASTLLGGVNDSFGTEITNALKNIGVR